MRSILLAILLLTSPMARAEGEDAGAFDYYVLALSWTPSWCATEGDGRDADQCDTGRGNGFTLHGLWPQYEVGWPSWCRTAHTDPSRRQTAAMADIMGSGGLAWHQWKKHGRCSGLGADTYFDLSRAAYTAVRRPTVLRKLTRPVELPPTVIEEAFLEANPQLGADGVTITCRNGRIAEVRICLSPDLTPRTCAPDVRRDCAAASAVFPPIR
ncbi:MAG: ribonuclease T2 [Pseudomonadota bacterium]